MNTALVRFFFLALAVVAASPAASRDPPSFPPRGSYRVDNCYLSGSSCASNIVAWDSVRGVSSEHDPDAHRYRILDSSVNLGVALFGNGTPCSHWKDPYPEYPRVPGNMKYMGETDECGAPDGGPCSVWESEGSVEMTTSYWFWSGGFPVVVRVFDDTTPDRDREIKYTQVTTEPDESLFEPDEACMEPPGNMPTTYTYRLVEADGDWAFATGHIYSSQDELKHKRDMEYFDKSRAGAVWDLTDIKQDLSWSYMEKTHTCNKTSGSSPLPRPFQWGQHRFQGVEPCPRDSTRDCSVYVEQQTETLVETVWWYEKLGVPTERQQVDDGEMGLRWFFEEWDLSEPSDSTWNLIRQCKDA